MRTRGRLEHAPVHRDRVDAMRTRGRLEHAPVHPRATPYIRVRGLHGVGRQASGVGSWQVLLLVRREARVALAIPAGTRVPGGRVPLYTAKGRCQGTRVKGRRAWPATTVAWQTTATKIARESLTCDYSRIANHGDYSRCRRGPTRRWTSVGRQTLAVADRAGSAHHHNRGVHPIDRLRVCQGGVALSSHRRASAALLLSHH